MELADLVNQVTAFDTSSPREKLRLLAWFLHTHRGKDTFNPADIKACFDQLHMVQVNIALNLNRMAERTPPDLLKERKGFKLARGVRNELDAKYGVHHSVVQVSKLLAELPGKVPDLAEKNFLAEAIKCYRVEAYRACVVMTWNLAYSHLLQWILDDAKRLADFNAAIPRRFPKKPTMTIASYDGFLEELKESEVIEVCNTASLFNSNIVRILKEKLGKRNNAAHPASVVVVQSQADDVVTDLVNNVVLALT
jgi:hypothetical protein